MNGIMTGETEVSVLGGAGAGTLAALHRACFAGSGTRSWSEEEFATLLSLPGTSAVVTEALVAEAPVCETVPAGFALFRVAGGEGELLSIGVLPEARSKGHGNRLLSAVLRLAAPEAALLHLEVGEHNMAARRLYEKAGFEPSGRRPGYYGAGESNEDALTYSLTLEGHVGTFTGALGHDRRA